MALYYFHLRDGRDTLFDPEGRDVSDSSLLAGLAWKEARCCISQDALEGRLDLGQSIEVHDGNGDLVHRLSFRDALKFGE